jgi:AraC-like DNA-binding protein
MSDTTSADVTAPATPNQALATIVPNVARSLLGLMEDRGHSAERLCLGLGFSYQDLHDRDVMLSHRQFRELILRAQELAGDPALGLAVGARQTPVSWGLAGLAMCTCETLGEAMDYAIGRQGEVGAMVDHRFTDRGREMHIDLTPHVFDLRIEPFLVEEAFASVVAVTRYLIGNEFAPLRVDLGYEPPAGSEQYARLFRCPVRFSAGCHRITFESHWLGARLPGYDRINSNLVRDQLDSLLKRPLARHDLVESLATRIRSSMEDRPRQADLAREVNVSERTLRRRLGAQELGYRQLRDAASFERARDLLSNSRMTVNEVAQAVGYSDARAFRRAFKRWSGALPTQFRNAPREPT